MYPIRTHMLCMFTFCKWSLPHLPPPSFPESALRHHSMGSLREESASKLRLFRYFSWRFQLQASFGPPKSPCMLLFYILPGFVFTCLLACLLVCVFFFFGLHFHLPYVSFLVWSQSEILTEARPTSCHTYLILAILESSWITCTELISPPSTCWTAPQLVSP